MSDAGHSFINKSTHDGPRRDADCTLPARTQCKLDVGCISLTSDFHTKFSRRVMTLRVESRC